MTPEPDNVIEFARGQYAKPALEAIRKAEGIPFAQRKVIGRFANPFYEAKAPKEGGALWQLIRDRAARKIRSTRRLSAQLDDLIEFVKPSPTTRSLLSKKVVYKAGKKKNKISVKKGLEAKLDDLIEFAGQLPFKTVKSVGTSPLGLLIRKLKAAKPTLHPDFKKRPPANWGEAQRRISGYRLSAKLDEIIEFQGFLNPAVIGNVFGRGLLSRLASGVKAGASTFGKTAKGVFSPGPWRQVGSDLRGNFAQIGKATRQGWQDFRTTSAGAAGSAVARPSAMTAGMATGGTPGTNPLGKFAAARAGANPAVAAPVGGPPGMSVQPAAAAAVSPDAAKEVANQAGSGWQGKWGQRAIGAGIGIAGAGILASALHDEARRQEYSAWLDDIINFADPRPRNPLGQFTPQEGGPDPNAMATVYKTPQVQPEPSGLKTAATLLTGGALGAIGGSLGKEGYSATTKLIRKLAGAKKTKPLIHTV